MYVATLKKMQKFDFIAIFLAILIAVIYAYPASNFIGNPRFTGFPSLVAYDQLFYNALTVSLKYTLYPLTEPLTNRYPGFYPPLYYIILALISEVSGIAVPYIWNYGMRFVLPSLFFLSIYYFIKNIFDSRHGIIAALICSFAGTYYAFFSFLNNMPLYWNQIYIRISVIWTPFIIFYGSSGAESFSLIVLALFFYFTIESIEKPSDRRYMLLASICGAVVFMSHMFVTIFLVCTQVTFMYFTAVTEKSKNLSRWIDIVFTFLLMLFWRVMIGVYSFVPIQVIAATAVLVFIFSYLRSERLSPARVVGNILFISAILSSFYWIQVISQLVGRSGAGYYEYSLQLSPFWVPITPYLVHVGVFIILSLIGLYALYSEKSKHLVFFSSMLIAGLFLSFNHYFGINYAPYRFITYSFIPFSILGASGLCYMWDKGGRSRSLAIAFSLLIVISALNNFVFIQLYAQDKSNALLFDSNVQNGISWLRNNTHPEEVVSSASEYTSLLIRAYAENKVVIPFNQFVDNDTYDSATEAASSLILNSTDTAERSRILEGYDIRYIFIEPSDRDELDGLIYNFSSDSRFREVYESGNLSIFEVLH
jgi:hypothetical protein